MLLLPCLTKACCVSTENTKGSRLKRLASWLPAHGEWSSNCRLGLVYQRRKRCSEFCCRPGEDPARQQHRRNPAVASSGRSFVCNVRTCHYHHTGATVEPQHRYGKTLLGARRGAKHVTTAMMTSRPFRPWLIRYGVGGSTCSHPLKSRSRALTVRGFCSKSAVGIHRIRRCCQPGNMPSHASLAAGREARVTLRTAK